MRKRELHFDAARDSKCETAIACLTPLAIPPCPHSPPLFTLAFILFTQRHAISTCSLVNQSVRAECQGEGEPWLLLVLGPLPVHPHTDLRHLLRGLLPAYLFCCKSQGATAERKCCMLPRIVVHHYTCHFTPGANTIFICIAHTGGAEGPESRGAGEVFRGRQGWMLCYLCRPYTSLSPRCHVPPNRPIPFHFQRHRRQRGLLVSIFAIFFLLPPPLLLLLFNKAHKFACNCVLRGRGLGGWLTCSPPTATLPPTGPPPAAAAAADQSPAKCSFRLAALSHLPFACS